MTSPLSPLVLRQVKRLGGKLPEGPAAPREVDTTLGKRALSPAVATFLQATWSKTKQLVFGDPEAALHFVGSSVTEPLASGHTGALYAIASARC